MQNRRQVLAGVAAVAATASAQADPFDTMTWLNPPAEWSRDGDRWQVRAKPKTDFWRKTFTGSVDDSGHFLHRAVAGKFRFEARVMGAYATQFDQAGLMVRQDALHWLKCGTEFFQGRRNASVVVTHEYSDWSTLPDLSQNAPVWWRLERSEDAVNVYASADGDLFTLLRSAYFAPAANLDVGLVVCAPAGPGFEAVFDKLKLS